MRFMMTAKAVAQGEATGLEVNELTQKNIDKVTRYRDNGEAVFNKMVDDFRRTLSFGSKKNRKDKQNNTKDEESAASAPSPSETS